jgi:hypothetical protein
LLKQSSKGASLKAFKPLSLLPGFNRQTAETIPVILSAAKNLAAIVRAEILRCVQNDNFLLPAASQLMAWGV